MKFTVAIFAFLAAFVVIEANPISVSNNNVGDIVTVGVNLNAQLSSNIEANIITVLMALVNQQAAIINGEIPATTPTPIEPSDVITPELLNQLKNLKITPEMIEGVKKMMNVQ